MSNNNSPFVRLSQEEIRDLYNTAANFVKTHMRNSDSPNMCLPPYSPQFVGQTHLTVPIHGANNLKKTLQLFKQLEEHFGLDLNGEPPSLYEEYQADGTGLVTKMNLPIVFKKTQSVFGEYRGGGRGKANSAAPTLEWPLFLLLVEVGLCGFMYYRIANGIAF